MLDCVRPGLRFWEGIRRVMRPQRGSGDQCNEQAQCTDDRGGVFPPTSRSCTAPLHNATAYKTRSALHLSSDCETAVRSLVDDQLVDQVVAAVGAHRTTAAALADAALDAAVLQAHEASQNALGDTGGSPLITIGGRTVFGPVFSSVPDPDQTLTVFDAVAALVCTPQFNQLERPRTHA
jgi:hypothetical protein